MLVLYLNKGHLCISHPVGMEKARDDPFCFRLPGWMVWCLSCAHKVAGGPASVVLRFLYGPVEDLGVQLSDPSRNSQSTPRNRNRASTM